MWSKWISLKDAVEKYHIKEEIVLLWLELGKFNETRKKGEQLLLNAEKLDEYVRLREANRVASAYVDVIP